METLHKENYIALENKTINAQMADLSLKRYLTVNHLLN